MLNGVNKELFLLIQRRFAAAKRSDIEEAVEYAKRKIIN
jgi:hypothetical protein